jgi:hypothetical protein
MVKGNLLNQKQINNSSAVALAIGKIAVLLMHQQSNVTQIPYTYTCLRSGRPPSALR